MASKKEHIEKIYNCLKEHHGAIEDAARYSGVSRQWFHRCFFDDKLYKTKGAKRIYLKAVMMVNAYEFVKAYEDEQDTKEIEQIRMQLAN